MTFPPAYNAAFGVTKLRNDLSALKKNNTKTSDFLFFVDIKAFFFLKKREI